MNVYPFITAQALTVSHWVFVVSVTAISYDSVRAAVPESSAPFGKENPPEGTGTSTKTIFIDPSEYVDVSGSTVTVQTAEYAPSAEVTVTVQDPGQTAVTLPSALTEATDELDEVQVTVLSDASDGATVTDIVLTDSDVSCRFVLLKDTPVTGTDIEEAALEDADAEAAGSAVDDAEAEDSDDGSFSVLKPVLP